MMAMPHAYTPPMDATTAANDDDIDHFERAQQQALEMLFQQCVDDIYAGEVTTLASSASLSAAPPGVSDLVSHRDAASFMEFLAQACEKASDKLQEIAPDDVAKALAAAVAATQQSLRDVQSSVHGVLQDPETMQLLGQQFDEADEQLQQLRLAHATEQALLMGDESPQVKRAQPAPLKEQQVAVASNEESLRSMMQFADSMCGVLDNALGTISKDEYDLAAQLSLSIAQKLLEAGQSLFMSIGDDIADKGDRSDRITIEELVEDDETSDARATPKKEKRESIAAKRLRQKREQRRQATAVRSYVLQLADKAQKGAAENPVAAAAIGMFTFPFIGLAIPVASMIGLALVLEKYYPELTSLVMELFSNFVQMAKLWYLLVKISARQLASVAKQCLVSWHDHAAQHGYVTAGKELVTTGCSLSWVCVSYLYNAAVNYARPTAV